MSLLPPEHELRAKIERRDAEIDKLREQVDDMARDILAYKRAIEAKDKSHESAIDREARADEIAETLMVLILLVSGCDMGDHYTVDTDGWERLVAFAKNHMTPHVGARLRIGKQWSQND